MRKTKDPSVILALGKRLFEAKRTLSPEAYEALLWSEPELRHEAKRSALLRDKVGRLITIYLTPAIRDNVDKLPWTGWGTLRELPKLGNEALIALFERGAIHRRSTREDIDRLRSAQKAANVAARHRGDW